MRKNGMQRQNLFWLALALLPWMTCAEELAGELAADGGMETWKATGPRDNGWDYLTVNCRSWALGKDAQGNVLTPAILAQLCGGELMKAEERDVHSGQKALRLKGEFYLRTVPAAGQPRVGDEYLVEYWAKGSGETIMNMHVGGAADARITKRTGQPAANQWARIETRFQIVGQAPELGMFRLFASEEMLIDDLSVRRVVPEDARPLSPVLPELAARVAFAPETDGPIEPDGRLNEPAWARAVKVAGLRAWQDQARLMPAAGSFQVLYDRQALYLGVEVLLPDCRQVLENLKNSPLRKSDGALRPRENTFTGRHSVEVFLQPPDQNRYCQFVASLDGYRYDGAGMDGAWQGAWNSGVQAESNRWVLEMRIPASDFKLDKLTSNTCWRLNVCINKDNDPTTWAAVGPAFHNPNAFGDLILADFQAWCAAKLAERAAVQKRLQAEARAAGLACDARLADIAAYVQAIQNGGPDNSDWEAMTKRYAVLNYVDYSYRCLQAEIRYQASFRAPQKGVKSLDE